MSDISDGRLGGFVPLQTLQDIQQPTEDVIPNILPQDISGQNGFNFSASDLLDGLEQEGVIRLPNRDGVLTPVPVDQLSDEQLAALSDLGRNIRIPGTAEPQNNLAGDTFGTFVRNDTTAGQADSVGRTAITRLVDAEAERRREAGEQAELQRRTMIAELGGSHPEVTGRRGLLEQRLDPLSTSGLSTLNRFEQRTDDFFSTQRAEFLERSRATERKLRSAVMDIQSFIESEFGEDVDVSDLELIALQETAVERLEQTRLLREEVSIQLDNQRAATLAGDFSNLPASLQPTGEQLLMLETESINRQHTASQRGQLIDFMRSTSLADRYVVEAVRSFTSGTFRDLDEFGVYVESLAWLPDTSEVDRAEFASTRRSIERAIEDGEASEQDLQELTGPPLLSEEERDQFRAAVQTLLGLDASYNPGDQGLFNVDYLPDDDLLLLDNYQLGIGSSLSNFDTTFSQVLGTDRAPLSIISNRAQIEASQSFDPEDNGGNSPVGFDASNPRIQDPFGTYDPQSFEVPE